MNILQAIKMSLKSILSNKMRSFLTMLGIIIGVAAVIMMVSMVESTTAMITEEMNSMGTNMITVMVTGRDTSKELKMKDAQKLVDDNPEYFIGVAPIISGNPTIKVGTENDSTSLVGTNHHFSTIQNAPVEYGRFIIEQDCVTRSKSVVIGSYIHNKYFPYENPIGQQMKISGQLFTVVGVLESKTTPPSEGSQDDRVIIPYTTAQRLMQNTVIRNYSFQAANSDVAEKAADKLEEILLKVFGSSTSYRVMSQAEMLEMVDTIMGTMSLMLGGIAGISLLVGGIGIMNIMLVSVTERTREIGIRKAIGARRKSILTQFLIESIVVSLIGGIFGIGLGIAGAHIIMNLMDVKAIVSFGVIALSTGFSIGIGVFFGWYPANKASKLNPIDALRFE